MKRYAHWILHHRVWVIGITIVITLLLGSQAANLKVVIDPVAMAPQAHPYVQATNRIDRVFGSKYIVLIGITPKKGDIFQDAVLGRIDRLTRQLEKTPGVVASTLISITAPRAKAIEGSGDSFEARPLFDKMPVTDADKAKLKARLLANPIYLNTVVSPDFRTAAILVELKERDDGFQKLVAPINQLVAAEAGPDVDIAVSGNPLYMDQIERFAARINWLFPIALLVIGLLHFEAFRTKQGMILPLVTALMAVLWGLGCMGALGHKLDIFNSPTPILILAVAAGHAVQLLKRYYEEYEQLRLADVAPAEANREAVIRSMIGVGPVMIIAGGVAALGFFSLLIFDISTIRSFGVFTGIGIASAVVLEMTFIPAVRSLLKPPSERQRRSERKIGIWDRIPSAIADMVVPAGPRRWVMAALVLLAALCMFGIRGVHVDSNARGMFSESLPLQQDDAFLNRRLGGTSGLYIMIEGAADDAIKSPAVLKAMESTQRYAETLPHVGKTISMVDFLQRMNQAMHGDQPSERRLPESADLVAQYLLLYSMSGDSGDFDTYVDNGYKSAKIALLIKTGASEEVRAILDKLKAHTAKVFGPGIKVSMGGEVTQTMALSDTLIAGKMRNIAQIALAVFVISALAFRSYIAGLIVLMPLVMAVLAVFGVMGAFGIPLNIPNSLISAMAVGIGADYAIYLLYRMREQARLGGDRQQAVRQALATAGKAALYVATAVAGGYGVLALSFNYNIHQWLSMFIVLAMIVSVFSALTLVPALVLYLEPAFIFNTEKRRPFWRVAAVLAAGTGLVLLTVRMAHADTLTPQAIMQKSQAATKVIDSVSDATFTLTNKDGAQRVRKTSGYTRLQANGSDNMRLVRFLAPADIKGTATLLIEHASADDEMWIYLPALGKVRRLSAGNKKDSFVGTDFSYGDVVGYKVEEWQHKLLNEENHDGNPCYVIESMPANADVAQNSGYSKRVTWVRKDNFVAARLEMYGPDQRLLKRIVANDIRQVGVNKRWQPMLSEAENLQTGHRTSIRFEAFRADQNVAEKLFTPKELENK